MPILLIAFLGVAIFGNSFLKYDLGPCSVMSLMVGVTAAYYAVRLLSLRPATARSGDAHIGNSLLWLFFLYGCVVVGLSYLGLYQLLPSISAVYFDGSYIPRQAYYLFFLPLIILAGDDLFTLRCIDFMRRHHVAFFIILYALACLHTHSLELGVKDCLLLSVFVCLRERPDKVVDLVLFLVVMLSPLREHGEMTQMAIRAFCAIFYLFGNHRNVCRYGIYAILTMALVCYVLPFIPLDGLELEANTAWRLEYWNDELSQLLRTGGLGVGYGSSYATRDFIGLGFSGPFAPTEEYTSLEKMYVVGCHNSFVSIAYRLGVIGAALLIAYLFKLACYDGGRGSGLSASAGFALAAALAIVTFNVGLESPEYFFLFAFAVAFYNASITSSGGRTAVGESLQAAHPGEGPSVGGEV